MNAPKTLDTRQIQVSVNRGFFFKDSPTAKLGRSWPKFPKGPASLHMTLHDALTRRFGFPAYLMQHEPTPVQRRLAKLALETKETLEAIGGAVRMHLFIVDVDRHDLTPEQVNEWWPQERPRVEALLAEHPGVAWRSRGGYRLCWALPEPFLITDAKSAKAWGRQVVTWIAYLGRRFGLFEGAKVDQLTDWTRYQRVPHDVRKAGGDPEDLDVVGNVECIGTWAPELEPTDIAAGAAWKPERAPRTKAERAAKASRDADADGYEPPAPPPEGGLFRRVIESRGLRCEPTGEPGVFDIECPRSHLHSADEGGRKDYAGKTLLYDQGRGPGWIQCLSDGCQQAMRDIAGQLALFTSEEIERYQPPNPEHSADEVFDAEFMDDDYVPEPPDGAPCSAGDSEGIHLSSGDAYVEMAQHCCSRMAPLVRWRQDFYQWDGCVYRQVDDETIRVSVRPTLESMTRPGRGGMAVPLNPGISTMANVVEAINMVSGVFHPPHTEQPFMRDGSGCDVGRSVAFKNGTALPGSDVVAPPDPERFSTFVVGTEFDARAKCPTWDAFLDAQWADDPESKALLQEWFGYCLSGWNGLHKMMFLRGPRRSGKGTTIGVLERLMGSAFGEFCVPELGGDFGMEPFINKRVMVDGDVRWDPSTVMRVLSRMLKLTGGDGTQANRKHKSHVVVKNVRVMMAGNEIPSINDRTGAVPGRLLILEQKRSFFGKEDPTLGDKLAEELPGIAAWAMRGLERLLAAGRFTVPAYHEEVQQDIADSGNPVRLFVRESCEFAADGTVEKAVLRSRYVKWSKDHGRGVMSSESFSKALKTHAEDSGQVIDLDKRVQSGGRRVRVIEGLKLQAPEESVSRADLITIGKWVREPTAITGYDSGRKIRENLDSFTVVDVLEYALEVPRERHPQHEHRVLDALRQLGLTPDEDGGYLPMRPHAVGEAPTQQRWLGNEDEEEAWPH